MVKNLPVMWETWIQSLGQEDPQEQGMATRFSILTWKKPLNRGAWQATVHGGHKESDMTEYIHMHAWGSKIPHVHGMVKKKKEPPYHGRLDWPISSGKVVLGNLDLPPC